MKVVLRLTTRINVHATFPANYPTDALSMSYCFESCTAPKCTSGGGCVSGIVDAVNPQRTLTAYPGVWADGFKCDKGAMYADKANGNGNVILSNLGTTVTNKTLAILLKHEVKFPADHAENDVELDDKADKGDWVSREIQQKQAFIVNR